VSLVFVFVAIVLVLHTADSAPAAPSARSCNPRA
jgi:hypothetical protein